jgi:hypothetical protein
MLRHFIFTSLAFTLLLSCKNEQKSDLPADAINPSVIDNPVTASTEKNSKDNVPVLKFDSDTHDFGTIVEGEKVSFAYKFRNVGNATLVIRAAQGSCGCTVPEYPKDPVPPGGEGIINVTFNSEGKEGKQDKTVTIISNTMPNTYTLNVIGNVEKAPE